MLELILTRYKGKMMKKTIIILLFLLILTSAFADSRNTNIDFYILLDKSLSMVEEISDVTSYISNYIFKELVIPGDSITVINFYGKTEVLLHEQVGSESEIIDAQEEIQQVLANGLYTDIGNALDTLIKYVDTVPAFNEDSFLLLITDGKQEAPEESPYFSPDGSFNHNLLETSKVIQKQGWKMHILGIGTESVAKELAYELGASYSEAENENPEDLGENLKKATENLLYSINVEQIKQTKKLSNGLVEYEITLSNEDMNEAHIIQIEKISLENIENVLLDAIEVTITPNKETVIVLPLDIKDSPLRKGELRFFFSSQAVFQPSVLEITIDEQSWTEGNFIILIISLLSIAIIIFVITLIRVINYKLRKKEEEEELKRRQNEL